MDFVTVDFAANSMKEAHDIAKAWLYKAQKILEQGETNV